MGLGALCPAWGNVPRLQLVAPELHHPGSFALAAPPRPCRARTAHTHAHEKSGYFFLAAPAATHAQNSRALPRKMHRRCAAMSLTVVNPKADAVLRSTTCYYRNFTTIKSCNLERDDSGGAESEA